MPDGYLRRNERAAWRVYDGEAIIVSPDDSTLHTVNRAGTLVWEAADGATPWGAIVARVAGAFALDAPDVEPDIATFVLALEGRGLIARTDRPGEPAGDRPSDPPVPVRAAAPYEAPRVLSEAIFETTALACGKRPMGGGKCNHRPKNS
jgi:hypothetical protein